MTNILICDDEKSYQEILEYKVRKVIENELKINDYNIKCVNSLSKLNYELNNKKIDIVFLDIMINNRNSIDFLISKSINTDDKSFIIITSFPIESYKLSDINCTYFLIKQKMTDDQLNKALIKALDNTDNKNEDKRIIKAGNRNHTINIKDITYIETFNNNITIHFLNKSILTVYSSLKDFSKQLNADFLRCHKSYMINMRYIKRYEPHKFFIDESTIVPIPTKKYSSVIEQYKAFINKY